MLIAIKGRIIHSRQSRVTSPAFYVYMSTDEASPGPHHTLIFNSVITNIGNAYNQYSGIFTAPSSGMYVLSYTITADSGASIPVEIVKNADVIGSLLTRAYGSYRQSVSSTVVVNMNAGDVCYVRTSGSGATTAGSIYSRTEARTSFTGWRIE
ncbi:complement C1q tumor necrosis factor-related protein 3-like [Mytilus californianus]|uniref:complement C1q tumor necrosis factor-related protein 3-like n=1 Tax=Mytilus californianus TaxID=6549 RepID=UPI002245D2C9|nr:complement C1q tumor necrosis factor-related protein 3-like [Mytilus californianus]